MLIWLSHCSSLRNLLSHQTILEHLPWVSDVEEELRRKQQEAKQNKQEE